MKQISVTAADIKAAQTQIPFSFYDLESGKGFMLDSRNNTVIFRASPTDGDLNEALDILKTEGGFSEDITLDHLVGHPDDKYLVVTSDLHFSVKAEMINKIIRPNRAAWHYDLLIVKTNEGIGNIPSYIGYPVAEHSCGCGYEIGLQYEEGGPKWYIYPTMVWYIPDDQGYKAVSEEKVPQDIIDCLRERELDYIRISDAVKDINRAADIFKDLFFKTVERHKRLLK